MAGKHLTDPVNDNDVPKVDNAIAVGEDLEFQEKWWTFERVVWALFVLVLIADALGAFGEGWLSKRSVQPPGSAMHVQYDAVLRTGTPDTLSVQFDPEAATDGKVKLLVSRSVVKELGAQRVIPQPEVSTIVPDGFLYTFPTGPQPGQVQFELEPGSPGVRRFSLQVVGHAPMQERIVVVP
jgi:hypothetical protein